MHKEMSKTRLERILIDDVNVIRRSNMCKIKSIPEVRHIIMRKPNVRKIRPLQDPTELRRKFRRMALCVAILYLLVPCVAAGQSLTIVSDPYPPLGYVKDGKIVGVSVDLIKLLLQKTGIEGNFRMYPWARAYKMAQKEKDILIYQLTYTEERARLFQLVGPIVGDTDCLWKLKSRMDIVLNGLEDAKRFRIGVVRGYYVHKYLLQNGFEEGKNLEPVHNDDINIKKLLSGRIDMMFLAELVFNYRIKELGYNRDDFEKALPVISNQGYLGFSRQTSPDVVKQFEEALKAIKKDGSYARIMGEYGVQLPKDKTD